MVSSYNILCPVTYGPGAACETGRVCKNLGTKKALVVTEKSILDLGIVGKVTDSLKEARIEFRIFDGVVQDAPDYVVAAGAAAAKEMGADTVVGVGGGSSLDTAKGISVLTASGLSIEEFMIPGPPVDHPKLITVMVPTTFGTGSESTQIAVINDTKNNYKNGVGVIPSAAIVDPELTLGLPKSITVYTGMDALSHAMEVLCSNMVENPHSDVLAYDAIERILKWLPVAAEDINNLEARENLAIASNFAGIAFADAIVNLGHAIAHAIGAYYHVPHGIACAWVTPVVAEFMAPVCGDKYRRVAGFMGLNVAEDAPAQVGSKVADWLRCFMKKLDVPTCTSFDLDEEKLVACTEYLKSEGMTNFGKRVPKEEELPEIMRAVYNSCK
jgi:alcohol dehydrogenase